MANIAWKHIFLYADKVIKEKEMDDEYVHHPFNDNGYWTMKICDNRQIAGSGVNFPDVVLVLRRYFEDTMKICFYHRKQEVVVINTSNKKCVKYKMTDEIQPLLDTRYGIFGVHGSAIYKVFYDAILLKMYKKKAV